MLLCLMEIWRFQFIYSLNLYQDIKKDRFLWIIFQISKILEQVMNVRREEIVFVMFIIVEYYKIKTHHRAVENTKL